MAKNNKPSKLGEILKNITRSSIEDQAKKERDKSYDIRSIFEKMELELISSMKKAFFFHQNEEQKEGFSWEQWQLSKLRAIEKYRKQNKKIIGSYARPIQTTINRELKGNYQKGQSRLQKFFGKVKELLKKVKDIEVNLPNDMAEQLKTREYINNELGRETTPPPDKDFFGVNDKKLNALQSTVENDLKIAQQSVLRKMDDVYRQTIFKTHIYLQSGVKSLNKAIDMATKDFLNQGINCIVYKDGKKVNIASYAEMALRTASQRATFLGEGKKRDEFGIHLVVVSAHANTCEKCMPWQGKVLIDDVFSHPSQEYIQEHSKKYPLLSEAIKAGLLHPNCRHTLITYFEGITQIPTIPDGDAAIKVYEAEQKQRAIEREIRKWKRTEAGTCDLESQQEASRMVKRLEIKLKDHLNSNTQLRRAYNREDPEGINSKTLKNHEQALKQKAQNDIIENIRKDIENGKYDLTLNKEAYEKHIEGSKRYEDYIDRLRKKGSQHIPSSLSISYDEAQELIKKFAGTGKIIANRGQIKELIKNNDKIIGVYRDIPNGIEEKTTRFSIHYSKANNKGAHIVPMKEENNV